MLLQKYKKSGGGGDQDRVHSLLPGHFSLFKMLQIRRFYSFCCCYTLMAILKERRGQDRRKKEKPSRNSPKKGKKGDDDDGEEEENPLIPRAESPIKHFTVK